jgi:AraC-like DNA-binding protein
LAAAELSLVQSGTRTRFIRLCGQVDTTRFNELSGTEHQAGQDGTTRTGDERPAAMKATGFCNGNLRKWGIMRQRYRTRRANRATKLQHPSSGRGSMQDHSTPRSARISTQDFPDNKRLAMWREVYGRGVTQVDIEPIGDAPFHADAAFSLLPGVSIVAGSRSPAHYSVTPELAGRGRDIIAVSMLRRGVASATQFGKDVIKGVGSASVLTPDDPSTSTLHTDGSFITLALNRPAILARVPDLSAAFGQPIPSENAALRLLIRYLDVLLPGNELESPDIAHSVSAHIIDLAALALGARGDSAEIARQRGARAARMSAMRADIMGQLGNSDLSTDMMALRHGISPRYLRRLFEQDGSSFSAFVLVERLAKAHLMLMDRRYLHLNIAQIIHESGFGDISYFNRAFRRRYNATPSDIRAAARRERGAMT